jgi:hypothetical protein
MTDTEFKKWVKHATYKMLYDKLKQLEQQNLTNIHLSNDDIKKNNRWIAIIDSELSDSGNWINWES